MQAAETLDLRIDSIAAGGDGVGRHDGMVVFVPRTAPGDLARVSARRQDRLMRGRVLELIHPSAVRVDPPCAHYMIDRCGGCQIQHLSYEAQLDAKAGIVRDSLTRIGRFPVDAPEVEPSDNPWRYRRKLTLALRRRGERWIAGLHRYDAPDEVFELEDCPITDEQVLGAWSLVLGQQQLLPRAQWLRGAVRLLEGGFSFTLEGDARWSTHERFFDAIPALSELWWKAEGKSRRLLHSREGKENAGASFTQVNAGVAAALRNWVTSRVLAYGPATVVDAYSGTGDLAVALAREAIRVTAIEIDRDAARVCAARLPEGSRAVSAPVEVALPQTLPADVVILNPPRAGVDPRVSEILKAQSPKPRAVLYVSCNPATLARDVRRMEAYSIRSLRGFDMFPQTAHVETVCELVPSRAE
jgi:23S rRNA (uracil1939-C5)-methyltransferase